MKCVCMCVTVMYLNMYLNNELYTFLASVIVTDADMPSMTSVRSTTLLVFRSTAAALCNYNENTFMCSYVVCTCANAFAMLCICREFHGVSVL